MIQFGKFNKKVKQAYRRSAILKLVPLMKLYKKNTKLSITIQGDGQEIFDYSLPHPINYTRNGNAYTLEYALKGYFSTKSSYEYLNDIIARFTLSMKVLSTNITSTKDDGIELSYFRGLKSIQRANNYEKGDRGEDNVFWSIKLYTEDLIRQSGEGNLIAYSLLESFAFSRFIERSKDKSTLRAKCRGIWNWYDEREWTIPTRQGKGMTKEEAAKYSAAKNAATKKAKVIGAIEALNFLQEKLSIANVSRQAQVSRDTAKKYLIELGLKK